MRNKTLDQIIFAQGQQCQALQNLNYADENHIDKAIRELSSANDNLIRLLVQATKEVKECLE